MAANAGFSYSGIASRLFNPLYTTNYIPYVTSPLQTFLFRPDVGAASSYTLPLLLASLGLPPVNLPGSAPIIPPFLRPAPIMPSAWQNSFNYPLLYNPYQQQQMYNPYQQQAYNQAYNPYAYYGVA